MEIENEVQQSALREFKERISDLDLDGQTYIRFLIARQYDVKKAEVMIRNSIRWRNEVHIDDNYLVEMPMYLKEDFPWRFTGVSKNGGAVLWLPLGLWKARYWIERGKKDEVTRLAYHMFELCLIRMRELGNMQTIIIYDLAELTYYKVGHLETLRVLYAAFQILEQNYPEILQDLIVVNAPWVFSIAFNFIKPIVSTRTMDKVQIFGSQNKEWLPVLEKLCMEDAIPKECYEN